MIIIQQDVSLISFSVFGVCVSVYGKGIDSSRAERPIGSVDEGRGLQEPLLPKGHAVVYRLHVRSAFRSEIGRFFANKLKRTLLQLIENVVATHRLEFSIISMARLTPASA